MTKLKVIYDACVLFPASLRDLLIHLAVKQLVQARWSDEIHEEWIQNLLRKRPRLKRELLEQTRLAMDGAVRDCLVKGYEAIIPTLQLPDPNDRHVLAAAIHTKATLIVTSNLKDFPKSELTRYGIEAITPDDFVCRLIELDIQRVPLSAVLEQYREYIVVIKEIDVNASGDFLAVASSLVEMKLTAVLNEKIVKSSGEQSDAIEVEQQDLAVQLLEYKKYCDAAALLQQRSERWQVRFPRLANDLPPRSRDLANEQIQEIELWDLVSAFGRILRGNTPAGKHQVVYDDTPIAVHMNTIHQRLQLEKRLAFRSLFRYGQHKSSMVGLFLASLELVRHEFANVYQEINYGEIELSLRQSSKPLDFASLNGIT